MAAQSVAQVVIDVDVAHLDRPFDYAIPKKFQGRIHLGSAVRVNWGGVRRTGWVVGVVSASKHQGELAPILVVLGEEPQFTAAMLSTYRYLALRGAATLSQVLSLAIPPRRAKIEKASLPRPGGEAFAGGDDIALARAYPGVVFHPGCRAVLTAVPHLVKEHLASVIRSCLASETPVIVVVSTVAQAESLYAWIQQGCPGVAAYLVTANQDPAERYRAHLAGMHGEAQIIVGTRMAAWSPSGKPAMMLVWDEASDHQRERRSPRVDALDIAVARSHLEGFGFVAAGFARSIKAQALVDSKWAQEVLPTNAILRQQIPQIRVSSPTDIERDGSSARALIPDSAFQVLRKGLESGPVLVQVPRASRTVVLPCSCGEGDQEEGEICRQCGAPMRRFEVGIGRVAADLGRAFPQTKVVVSSAEQGIRRDEVNETAIVVATPGAEPSAGRGYQAVVCIEADLLVYSDDLGALEQGAARWYSTFALAAPGAPALLRGEIPAALKRWLILWHPEQLAQALLKERAELGFYPARWIVAIEGRSLDVGPVVSALEASGVESLSVLGTVMMKEDTETLFAQTGLGNEIVRSLVACGPKDATELMEAVAAIRATRSMARQAPVSVVVNPPEMF